MRLIGLSPRRLLSHLAAIGLLRVLDEQRMDWWPPPRLNLAGDGIAAMLVVPIDEDDLIEWLLTQYQPTVMISPWNGGSGLGLGYAPGGKKQKSSNTHRPDFDALPQRWNYWHESVAVADALVAEAKAEKWTKQDLVSACRTRSHPAALTWSNACWIGSDDESQIPNWILGTGGNIARMDMGANAVKYLTAIDRDARSRSWLVDLLTGSWDTPLLTGTYGHLDRANPGETTLVNPWEWLLAMEGLIGMAALRTTSRPCPVQLRPSPIEGQVYEQDLNDSQAHELWLPIWNHPLSYDDVTEAVSSESYLAIAEDDGTWTPAIVGAEALDAAKAGLPQALCGVARHPCLTDPGGRSAQYRFGQIISPAAALDRRISEWLTYTDISRQTGIPVKTLSSLLSRGRMPRPDDHLGQQPVWHFNGAIKDWIRNKNLGSEPGPPLDATERREFRRRFRQHRIDGVVNVYEALAADYNTDQATVFQWKQQLDNRYSYVRNRNRPR